MSNLFYDYVRNNDNITLTDDRIRKLIVDYKLYGNTNARDEIVVSCYQMILKIINDLVSDVKSREEYISVATFAIIKCIDKFDLEGITKFSTLAYTYISNAIKSELVNNQSIINIPYVERINANKYRKAKERLESTYGRKLNVDELAEMLDIKASKIADYESELDAVASLDKTLYEDIELKDVISTGYSLEDEVIDKDQTNSLYDNINLLKDKREQLVIMYTYGLLDGEEHTQEEARDMLVQNGYPKLSRQGVQKIQANAIKNLRKMFN